MKRTIFFALILLLAGCGGGPDASSDAESAPSGESQNGAETTASSELREVTIDASGGEPVEVRVEIADDDAERARGLMERTELAEERGMLFVFDEEETRSFWMKDTLIPLSIAYIDADGRIVDIQNMKPLDTTTHPSAEPAQYALEVNKGFFAERGVEVGDRAKLPE